MILFIPEPMNSDCILYVLRFVSNGCLYKNLLFTCKLFRDFYRTGFYIGPELWNHIRFVRKFSNHLSTLIKNVPGQAMALVGNI